MHLNRLLNTRQHTFGAASGSFMGNWTQPNTNTTDNYAETFRYDANGNILQLNRNGNSQHPDWPWTASTSAIGMGLSTP